MIGVFYIGYDNEGFESAKKATAWSEMAPMSISTSWAMRDIELNNASSFQIYDENGNIVCSLEKTKEQV